MTRSGGAFQDGCGDVGHLRTPGYKGGTPGGVAAANRHSTADVIVVPIIILGVIIIAAIIGTAIVTGVAAFTVSFLGQGHVDDVVPLVSG